MLVYDVTNRNSFDHVTDWISKVKQFSNTQNHQMLVIGNKVDKFELRKVMKEEGETLATENGMAFLETSAKTAENVDLVFK